MRAGQSELCWAERGLNHCTTHTHCSDQQRTCTRCSCMSVSAGTSLTPPHRSCPKKKKKQHVTLWNVNENRIQWFASRTNLYFIRNILRKTFAHSEFNSATCSKKLGWRQQKAGAVISKKQREGASQSFKPQLYLKQVWPCHRNHCMGSLTPQKELSGAYPHMRVKSSFMQRGSHKWTWPKQRSEPTRI